MSHKILRPIIVLMLVIGLLVVLQVPQSAHAAGPWYVTTTGDDNNDCLSPSSSCATINGAIGKASAGDTINVATGTYTGNDVEVVLIDKDIMTCPPKSDPKPVLGLDPKGGSRNVKTKGIFGRTDHYETA